MRLVQKFLALTRAEKRLLAFAWWRVCLSRIGLWIKPKQMLARLGSQETSSVSGHGDSTTVEQVTYCVRVASRFVPGASCLTQAIAAQSILAKTGHKTEIRFGVARDPDKNFMAHAWLESEGKIVLGGFKVPYQPLPQLSNPRRA